jgi:hypothetical protein
VKTKEILKSQYRASIQMLKDAVENCPDSLWNNEAYTNPFWHVVFHAIFYTHFYLHATQDNFIPWEKHKDELVSLEDDPGDEIYTKEEIIDYIAYFERKIDELVDDLDLEAGSGFYWLPFNKLELQLYNIRHIQHHTGELSERLGKFGDIEVGWVGMMP